MSNVLTARPTISRRRVISGIAWSVPVIAAVSSTPAFAASGSGGGTTPQPLPSQAVAELSVDCYNAWNANPYAGGPIGWAGGHIGWWSGSSSTTSGIISWIVTVATPAGTTHTITTGARTITRSSEKFAIPEQRWGTPPMPSGTYTITLTVNGAAGVSKSNSKSVTIEPRPASQ